MQTSTSEIGSGIAIGVEIRPLGPTARNGLAAAFSRLSEQTRRRRFGGLASRLGERALDRLMRIDHHQHEAIAAIPPDSDRMVGLARCIALPHVPRAAEVAGNGPVLGWIARAGGAAAAHDGDATVYGMPLDRLAEERRAA